MDKLISKLFDIVDELPIWARILLLFLIAAFIYVARIMLNPRVQNNIISRITKIITRITKNDLTQNHVFTKKEYYLNAINNIFFEDRLKEKVFKILLTQKLEGDVLLLSKFIKEVELNKLHVNEFCSELIKLTRCMIDSFEEQANAKLCKEFGDVKGNLVFNFLIQELRNKRKDKTARILDFIDDKLRYSKIYDNNIERMDAYMYEIEYSIRTSITNNESDFRGYNGKIAGIINGKITEI